MLPGENHSRDIAAGVIESWRKAELRRVGSEGEHDRNRRCCSLCRYCSSGASADDDDGRSTADQIGCQRRESVKVVLCPAILNRHVLVFDESGLFETLLDAGDCASVSLRLVPMQKS